MSPPWPDLIVSCGRRALGPSIAARNESRKEGGNTRLVVIQHPRMSLRHFDLIAAPRHDGLVGDKIVVTEGAVHRVNAAKLAPFRELERGNSGQPIVSVSIGGKNAAFYLPWGDAKVLAQAIKNAASAINARLLVTASRRTDPESEAAMREILSGPDVEFWDGTGENPYFRYLATADVILATGD